MLGPPTLFLNGLLQEAQSTFPESGQIISKLSEALWARPIQPPCAVSSLVH
jgi:hypothetical protein